MNNVPESITDYLDSIAETQSAFGYVCMNKKQEIVASQGMVGLIELTFIDQFHDMLHTIPVLEGLLPRDTNVPTIIANVYMTKACYVDVHLFDNLTFTWILFIDKTQSAVSQQQEQQMRLTNDLLNEKHQLKK